MNTADVIALKETALNEAREAADAPALEAVRIKYLSRKGVLQEVMKSLKDLGPEERPEFGQRANELKTELTALVNDRKAAFAAGKGQDEATFDYTLPGQWRALGTKHPITQVTERIVDVFRTMGFTVASGPDIETVYHNFDALNTPADHPSRDPQDTFYLEDGTLLRSHTSPVQIRYMERHQPPVRIVAPGRCYRRDTPDATHSANFHQVEGLYVSEGVSLADLKGDIAYFARQIMGQDARSGSGRTSSRSPNPAWRSISPATCAAARAAGSASRADGSKSWAPAWSIRTCSTRWATIPSGTPATPSAWAWNGSP